MHHNEFIVWNYSQFAHELNVTSTYGNTDELNEWENNEKNIISKE